MHKNTVAVIEKSISATPQRTHSKWIKFNNNDNYFHPEGFKIGL